MVRSSEQRGSAIVSSGEGVRAHARLRTITLRSGGSSRIFSKALAAFWFMASAGSTIATRHPPATVVIRKNSERLRMSPTVISRATLPVSGLRARSTTRRAGCPPAATCRNTGSSVNISKPSAAGISSPSSPDDFGFSRNRANLKASVALPIPRGPAKSNEWCRRPALHASCSASSTVSCPNRRWFSRGCGMSRVSAMAQFKPKRRSMQFLIWISIASLCLARQRPRTARVHWTAISRKPLRIR